jgi:transcriptional regulator with XRE-family HTH domain
MVNNTSAEVIMSHDSSAVLIDHVLKHTGLSQAGLAKKLDVSRAQITKWKAGDHISWERESQLLTLGGLFETVNIEWALFAKTEANAHAWYRYVHAIQENVEWGNTLQAFLKDMPDIFVGHLIVDLCKLGAKVDASAPTEVWLGDDQSETTALTDALFEILEAWGQLYDWIDDTLEFDDLSDEAESALYDATEDLRSIAFDLALGSIETEVLTAIGIEEMKLQELVDKANQDARNRLHSICQTRTEYGLPITDDYFALLYLSPVELAERSWFNPKKCADIRDERLIKSYLPYGQRMILAELEMAGYALQELNKKVDALIGRSRD